MKKLIVCGKEYDIVYVEKIKGFQARIREDVGLIEVTKWSKSWIVENLIHEALHSINNTFSLKLQEKEIRILAPAIQIFLKENPELVKMLW